MLIDPLLSEEFCFIFINCLEIKKKVIPKTAKTIFILTIPYILKYFEYVGRFFCRFIGLVLNTKFWILCL